jgi:alcohol dehydrogenase class IV
MVSGHSAPASAPAADLAFTAEREQVRSFTHRERDSTTWMQPDALALLPSQLSNLGIRKPMLITGASVRQQASYQRVLQALEPWQPVILSPVPSHASVQWVTQAAQVAVAQGVDAFIAYGGGSCCDTAQATALLQAEGGDLTQYAVRFTPPSTLVAPTLLKPKHPVIAIPTTASGAEMTPSMGITDEHGHKFILHDVGTMSRVVLLDPVANLEVPPHILMSTGFNALAHVLEGLYSLQRTPITDALCVHAIPLLVQSLPAVLERPTSVTARAALMTAAHLAGRVIANARTALHHAICHAIGSRCGVGHGEANAVMLPHVLAFNATHVQAALDLALTVWPDRQPQDSLFSCVQALQVRLNVPRRLRDLGITTDQLQAVARQVMGERGLYFNPRTVTDPAEILALLERAY